MTLNGDFFQSTVSVANAGVKRTPEGYVDVEHVNAANRTRIHRFGGDDWDDYILERTTYPGYPLVAPGANRQSDWLRNIGTDPYSVATHYIQTTDGTARFYKFTFEQASVFLPDPFYVYYEQSHSPILTFNIYKTGTNTLVCRLNAGSSVFETLNGGVTRRKTSYAVTVYWNNV
jgi:hypothetical protein